MSGWIQGHAREPRGLPQDDRKVWHTVFLRNTWLDPMRTTTSELRHILGELETYKVAANQPPLSWLWHPDCATPPPVPKTLTPVAGETHVSVVIPFDVKNLAYMAVRATLWHPVPAFRHKLKGIGGVQERRDATTRRALERELEEEFPGWLQVPSHEYVWGEEGGSQMTAYGIINMGTVRVPDACTWHVFGLPTTLTHDTLVQAMSVAKESVPEARRLGVLPSEDDCVPGFREVLLCMTLCVAAAFPSVKLCVPA